MEISYIWHCSKLKQCCKDLKPKINVQAAEVCLLGMCNLVSAVISDCGLLQIGLKEHIKHG